jgi:hypothetical protein
MFKRCHPKCLIEASAATRTTTTTAMMTRGGGLGAFAAEKIIERIRSRMRYGFPLLKIGPMSPLKLDNRNCAVNLSMLQ